MKFTNFIYWLFKLKGLHLYSDRSLPYGIDHRLDIVRLGGEINRIFDVGANVGQTAKTYSSYWPIAIIFCFEPVSSTFYCLVQNTQMMLNVKCHQMAFGANSGSATIWLKESSRKNSLNSRLNQPSDTSDYETINIETVDEFCQRKDINNIDLLKLDVESYELDVLKGCTQMLESGKIAWIYAEANLDADDHEQTSFPFMKDFLQPLGYQWIGIYDKKFSRENKMIKRLKYFNALFKLEKD